ncbi:MAG TPA: ferrous iron transport protein A [Candidatus Altiarchaeales archaeon]|nr:MAG: ferrous iron transport protein A [Candidatus Altiarchaeales archaeon]HDN82997.1 ferrous iron transport protein A [Candidatus Altiarchaeales archaeon]
MSSVVPLAMLSEGEEGKIVSINAGFGLSRRLAELGFNPGTRIKVLRCGNGPILVMIRDGRVALGRGVAMKIFVEREK